MLYQCAIQTTVPQRIRNKDPQAESDRERLDDRAVHSASYHDRHSQTKSPFYAGQTVSVLNDAKTLWLPATVIRQAAHGSYLVEVIGGGRYRRARDHICERHPDAVKKDDTPPGNVAPATPSGLEPLQCTRRQQCPPLHLLLPQQPHCPLYPQQRPALHARQLHTHPCIHQLHPLELRNSRPVQHLLPRADPPVPLSPTNGLLRKCDWTAHGPMIDVDPDRP